MKKKKGTIIAGLLAAVLLTGCALPVGGQESVASRQMGSETVPPTKIEQEKTKAQPLTLVLPTEKAAMQEIIAELARQEGIELVVKNLPSGAAYLTQMQKALDETKGPALVWVESKDAAKELHTLGYTMNLADANSPDAMRNLAPMVTKSLGAREQSTTFGLPVGYYSSGYIVNLSLLSALIGEDDLGVLERSLINASWEEWEDLTKAITVYLMQPKKYIVKLGGKTYGMPRYRPESAKPTRGVFAPLGAPAGEEINIAINTALAAGFEDFESYNEALPSEKAIKIDENLRAIYKLMVFEHANTAQQQLEGTGDESAFLSPENAIKMLENGTALAAQATSKTLLDMQRNKPLSEWEFALIPLKMPYKEKEENTEVQEDKEETKEEDTEEDTEETKEIETEETKELIAKITELNMKMFVQTEGYFCVSKNVQQNTAIELLLRLYTSQQGQQAIMSQLNLLPFSTPYPSEQTLFKLGSVVAADELYTAVQGLFAQQRVNEAFGLWAVENLQMPIEWKQETEEEFLSACYTALGIMRMETE